MRIVVVHAHPSPSSFNKALFETCVRVLREQHHEVDAFDLYADQFDPVMSAAERGAYHTAEPILDPLVRRYADAVDLAEALVFVYPTWWSSMPAMLKGWLEKVMVPGIAFGFDAHGKVEPRLQHVRRIAGITSYGSPRWLVTIGPDNGRRTLMRALRVSTGFLHTRTTWLGLYKMDTAQQPDREAFLRRVEKELSSW